MGKWYDLKYGRQKHFFGLLVYEINGSFIFYSCRMTEMPTAFETTIITQQPKTLQNLTAKYCAKNLIMTSDCLEPEFTKLKPWIQNRIAPYLEGKWLGQFLCLHNSSLIEIEAFMDKTDKTKETTITFLYKFFSEIKPSTEDYSIFSLMVDCYISEKCNTFTTLPSKLYFLGMRDNLHIMNHGLDDAFCQYFSSCTVGFCPTFNPPAVSTEFEKFQNTIYSIHEPLLERPISTDFDNYDEIPRRLTWANYYVSQDRFPEALVQVLSSLDRLNPKVHSRLEYLDLMTLLIFIVSNLHLNIKCQSFVVTAALTLVVYPFDICQFIPPIIKMFIELGHFQWAKIIFFKCIIKNKHSQYYIFCLHYYAEGLIDYIENLLLYIITVKQFHRDCVRIPACEKVKSQGVARKKIHTLLIELYTVIAKMPVSSETDLFRAEYALYKAFIFKIEDFSRKYLASLNEAGGLLAQVIETAQNPLTKLKASVINLMYMCRGSIYFTEIISNKLGEINKASLSNLKCKLLYKSIIICCLNKFEFIISDSSFLNGLLAETIDSFSLLSNKRHYRLKLLKRVDKIFHLKQSHFFHDPVFFPRDLLKISDLKDVLLCQCLFPHFPEYVCITRQQLISNYSWMPIEQSQHFSCKIIDLFELDPFIKNHVAFGTSQLKV